MKKECNTVSFKNQVIYVGIDIHKNSWQVSIRHCRHQLANFSMNPDALKLAEHLRRNYPEAEYRSVYMKRAFADLKYTVRFVDLGS